MPQAFDNCVTRGGKVRTKTVNINQYIHICYIDGKAYTGEIKTKKNGSSKGESKKSS